MTFETGKTGLDYDFSIAIFSWHPRHFNVVFFFVRSWGLYVKAPNFKQNKTFQCDKTETYQQLPLIRSPYHSVLNPRFQYSTGKRYWLLNTTWDILFNHKVSKKRKFNHHSFFFLSIGREPSTWPANNCLQMINYLKNLHTGSRYHPRVVFRRDLTLN